MASGGKLGRVEDRLEEITTGRVAKASRRDRSAAKRQKRIERLEQFIEFFNKPVYKWLIAGGTAIIAPFARNLPGEIIEALPKVGQTLTVVAAGAGAVAVGAQVFKEPLDRVGRAWTKLRERHLTEQANALAEDILHDATRKAVAHDRQHRALQRTNARVIKCLRELSEFSETKHADDPEAVERAQVARGEYKRLVEVLNKYHASQPSVEASEWLDLSGFEDVLMAQKPVEPDSAHTSATMEFLDTGVVEEPELTEEQKSWDRVTESVNSAVAQEVAELEVWVSVWDTWQRTMAHELWETQVRALADPFISSNPSGTIAAIAAMRVAEPGSSLAISGRAQRQAVDVAELIAIHAERELGNGMKSLIGARRMLEGPTQEAVHDLESIPTPVKPLRRSLFSRESDRGIERAF